MAAIVDSVRPLETFPVDTDLSEEFLKKNDNGSKETPENRSEKLQEFLRLLNDYPELTTRTDDTYLLRFLRAKYFHTKHAFNLLKSYEEFKMKYHETWTTIDVPILKQLTLSGAVQVLPCRDQLQRRVFWLRGGLWKPSDCSIEYLLQAGGICGDATIVEPMTQVAGIVMIFDLKDVGMTHIKTLTPAFAKKMVHFLAVSSLLLTLGMGGLISGLLHQHPEPVLTFFLPVPFFCYNGVETYKKVLKACLPVRINALHVVNEPSIFSMIFSIYKAFLTEKMKKRLYFHGSNMASLHEHVTPSCLPPELGGTFGEVDPEEWYKVLMGDMVKTELKGLGYKVINDDK